MNLRRQLEDSNNFGSIHANFRENIADAAISTEVISVVVNHFFYRYLRREKEGDVRESNNDNIISNPVCCALCVFMCAVLLWILP
jgi:hypothetical protein